MECEHLIEKFGKGVRCRKYTGTSSPGVCWACPHGGGVDAQWKRAIQIPVIPAVPAPPSFAGGHKTPSPCTGCGGEKINPRTLQSAWGQEQILRDHLQGVPAPAP